MKVKDLLKFEEKAHKKKLPRDIRQLIFIDDKDLEKHLIHYIRTNKKLKRKLEEVTALKLCVSYVSKVFSKVL